MIHNTGDRLAGYLDNLGPGVALQNGAIRVGGAVLAVLDALGAACRRALVHGGAGGHHVVRREAGPVALLQLLGSGHKLLQESGHELSICTLASMETSQHVRMPLQNVNEGAQEVTL